MQPEDLKPLHVVALEANLYSKAILEDYCEVISKLTGVSPEDVRKRITKKYSEQAKLMAIDLKSFPPKK